MWYFAYGSNMNIDRMIERKVNFTNREFGLLIDYKLVFNKKAKDGNFTYANIVEEKGKSVEGVLYQVSEDGIKILDRKEGVPKDYLKIVVEITGPRPQKVTAITYIANPDKTIDNLLPTKEYLNHLLGGKDILTTEYYDILKQTPTID